MIRLSVGLEEVGDIINDIDLALKKHLKMINKKKISVLVEPIYLEDHSDPSEDAYLWAYKVKIKNNSEESIKLLSRH